MPTLLTDPNAWLGFLALTVMEVVLGIDNIVFISVLISRLPKKSAEIARRLGLGLALGARIVLLLAIAWIIGLTQPAVAAFGLELSWRDLILLAGGAFLIYKATHEMHAAIEEPGEHEPKPAPGRFSSVIVQIILIDMVFSIDSIVTAVGMTPHVEVMIAAVIVAVGIMYVASGPIARFIADHPTTKMLALAFLLLIGVSLSADGIGFHIPREYIYFAMGFSVLVEAANIVARSRKLKAVAARAGGSEASDEPHQTTRPESSPGKAR